MLTRFPLLVKINVEVLADRLRLDDIAIRELDQGRIGVRKIFDFHSPVSLNDPLGRPLYHLSDDLTQPNVEAHQSPGL